MDHFYSNLFIQRVRGGSCRGSPAARSLLCLLPPLPPVLPPGRSPALPSRLFSSLPPSRPCH
ncbi:hypothetical protein E2C01_034437 [Portunus trituberculatus]|uniref:Uncharacterized protein n=1 Tax=Portunus trituberculatus TaxID=210409 RepID=A0A5B7F8I4_PORTR|nr:hypothetical protein [Portunus trituberculatus]